MLAITLRRNSLDMLGDGGVCVVARGCPDLGGLGHRHYGRASSNIKTAATGWGVTLGEPG
jgi:hypothetical protein